MTVNMEPYELREEQERARIEYESQPVSPRVPCGVFTVEDVAWLKMLRILVEDDEKALVLAIRGRSTD